MWAYYLLKGKNMKPIYGDLPPNAEHLKALRAPLKPTKLEQLMLAFGCGNVTPNGSYIVTQTTGESVITFFDADQRLVGSVTINHQRPNEPTFIVGIAEI